MFQFIRKIFGVKTEFGKWMEEVRACYSARRAHSHQTAQQAWDSCERVEWMMWCAREKFRFGEPGWLKDGDFWKIKELFVKYNQFEKFDKNACHHIATQVYQSALWRIGVAGEEMNKFLANEIRKIVPKVGD